jgi:hypothetical protein
MTGADRHRMPELETSTCGKSSRTKGDYARTFRTFFGTAVLKSPRVALRMGEARR